ncbi:hypothetical protein LY78DRAFT_36704 [Colletotrichum sublineola]|nr:hypothetical protein LY78DRAFT_36704 [Colletotrichum sublineola]
MRSTARRQPKVSFVWLALLVGAAPVLVCAMLHVINVWPVPEARGMIHNNLSRPANPAQQFPIFVLRLIHEAAGWSIQKETRDIQRQEGEERRGVDGRGHDPEQKVRFARRGFVAFRRWLFVVRV